MAIKTSDNIQKTSLFDCYERTDRSGGRSTESAFEFFNRSAWRCAEITRAILESWFANIPQERKADLRGRFRADDRRHASALLELTTHEILRAVAKDVLVGPSFYGGHPDFSAIYRDTSLIVECTVAQESDVEFGTLQREKVVLDAVNSIQAGSFVLKLEPRLVGETQPPIGQLRSFLEDWLASLSRQVGSQAVVRGVPLDSREWKWQDWKLRFETIPFGSPAKGGPLGIIQRPLQSIVGKPTIGRALDKKAEKYKRLQTPYLIVAAERETLEGPEVIFDALLGREEEIIGTAGLIQTRTFDGLWGAPSNPKRRHVSAVLYRHRMRDAWSICSQVYTTDSDGMQSVLPGWQLVHNPAADIPLPRGMFPFATEHVWHSGQSVAVDPTRTLNEVSGPSRPMAWRRTLVRQLSPLLSTRLGKEYTQFGDGAADRVRCIETGGRDLRNMMTDTVTVIHKDGTRHEPIRASVQKNKIFIDDANLPLSAGDLIERSLPSGQVEVS